MQSERSNAETEGVDVLDDDSATANQQHLDLKAVSLLHWWDRVIEAPEPGKPLRRMFRQVVTPVGGNLFRRVASVFYLHPVAAAGDGPNTVLRSGGTQWVWGPPQKVGDQGHCRQGQPAKW